MCRLFGARRVLTHIINGLLAPKRRCVHLKKSKHLWLTPQKSIEYCCQAINKFFDSLIGQTLPCRLCPFIIAYWKRKKYCLPPLFILLEYNDIIFSQLLNWYSGCSGNSCSRDWSWSWSLVSIGNHPGAIVQPLDCTNHWKSYSLNEKYNVVVFNEK